MVKKKTNQKFKYIFNNTMLTTFISRAKIDTSYIYIYPLVFIVYTLYRYSLLLLRTYRFLFPCKTHKHTASDRNINTIYHFPKKKHFIFVLAHNLWFAYRPNEIPCKNKNIYTKYRPETKALNSLSLYALAGGCGIMIRYINYIVTLYIFKQILLYNVTLFKSICTSARAVEQMLLQLNYLFHFVFFCSRFVDWQIWKLLWN